MNYVLLFIALSGPSYMGDFRDEASCKNAVREIYMFRATPITAQGKVPLTKEIEAGVNLQLQLQKEFICVAKAKI